MAIILGGQWALCPPVHLKEMGLNVLFHNPTMSLLNNVNETHNPVLINFGNEIQDGENSILSQISLLAEIS